MSFVHHEPDTTVVPCLGCNEVVDPRELVRSGHAWTSCCLFHPYHFWCVRPGPTAPRVASHCADCGGRLDRAAMLDAIRWGATFPLRLHQRSITVIPWTGAVRERPGGAVARPGGIRLIYVARPPSAHETPSVLGDASSDDMHAEQFVCSRFELVHDDCVVADGPHQWRAQLRASPDDIELRAVYADWLEQLGEQRRAQFVRIAIEARSAIGEAVLAYKHRLHEMRAWLPGSWCRDVCRRAAS
jgi:uncharacterized protein (TIGR02996 family)